MAVVYFTSNASTGAGSLVEAVANAQPGDVVRPDESVFERGSTIEIVLASQLNVDKDLTLDASPFRVRLNGGGTKRGAYVASSVVAEFTAFDFVACYSSPSGGGAMVETSARASFNRCLFAGCDSTYGGGLAVQATGNATLNDCAVVGCRATVDFGGGVHASGDVVLNGVTAIGCTSPEKCDVYGNANVSLVARNSIVGAVQKPSTATFSAAGSVVDVAPSSVGFVASPPDDLTPENWNANAWQDWDLRLLDDASGAPSPYRDSGDVDAMSRYDLDGNFRGRETNGVATCSPGAYETIQADLFWVGRDATGAEVVSPSFLTSDGWAASRFATVSGDVAPQAGQTLFIGRDVAFVDRPTYPTISTAPRHKVVIGGGAVVSTVRPTESGWQINYVNLYLGAGSKFSENIVTQKTLCGSARFGDFAYCDAALGCGISNVEFDFVYVGANVEISTFISCVNFDERPFYRTLTVYRQTDAVAKKYPLSGTYRAQKVYVAVRAPGAYLVENLPNTRFICEYFSLGTAAQDELGSWFTHPATVELRGAAQAISSGTGLRYADEFVVDVNAATSATLNLSDQKIYGDAPNVAIALTSGRSARVVNDILSCASLTLNANAKLTVENATVKANALAIRNGATVEFNAGAPTDGATNGTVATYVNAILTATESASVGAATFTGAGYFATPPGTDTNSASFAETVRDCDYGANVSSFNASPNTANTALLSWVKQNLTPCVLIEEANGSVWNVVNNRATGDSLFVDISAPKTFRLFDGDKFFTASARPYGTAYELAEEQTIGYLKTLISTGYLN
ncbi:MAG: hypothetical protein J6W10_04065 [Kiritimatiellae bacterium]|nr:hypothetical protein [Kiritimatiellia bacterium]